MKQLLLDLTAYPAPTFANFVPGGNAEAVASLRAAAEGRAVDRVIYLWGDSGAGKTHLLGAFGMAVKERDPDFGYYEANSFPPHGIELAPEDLGPILVVDHIDDLGEQGQALLFNAFNARAFELLVVAGRAAPAHIGLRRDLATRLATGLTYRVLPISDDEKVAALVAHAAVRGFVLAEDVARYLVTHTHREMKTLITTLDAIDRYSLETGRPVTLPLIKDAIKAALDGEAAA